MLDFIAKNRNKIIVIAIVVVAVFFIFFRLDRADIRGDDALYSFRAVGYLDYLDSQLQTSPVWWFEKIPGWANLSFHDAPPLVILIQFIFFKLFGISIFTARLPFALAGVGSVILLYFLAKNLYGQKTALLSAGILTALNYHSWASRAGYLEPVALFFALLAFYFFILGLKDPKKFIFFGLACGLAFLSKYTTFFILPVAFLYLLLVKHQALISRYFIAGVVLAVLIFSPVLFYNFSLYQTRGHFDLQFAQVFGQDISQDWPIISGGNVFSGNIFGGFLNVWKSFSEAMSLPLFLLVIVSLLYFALTYVKDFKKSKDHFVVLVLFFLTLQFALVGSEIRFLSLFNPFIALMLVLAAIRFYGRIVLKAPFQELKKIFFLVALVLIFIFELFYNINTNLLFRPIGQAGRHYSSYRTENLGFGNLEQYFISEEDINRAEVKKIKSRDDLMVSEIRDLPGRNIYIYDANVSWFSALWYFRRFAVYQNEFFISFTDLYLVLPEVAWDKHFKELGVINMYYIKALDRRLYGGGDDALKKKSAENLAAIFARQGAEEAVIKNINNEDSFRIYKLKLN